MGTPRMKASTSSESSTLGLLVGETVTALTSPRRFARSLRDERHGLSTLLIALAAAASLGATVDVLATMTTGRDVPPSTIAVDAAFFASRVVVVVALAAAIARLAARALRAELGLPLAFAAVGLATAPLLLAPLALLPSVAGLWMIGLAVLVALVLWSCALVALNARALITGRRALAAAALAVPLLLYGVGDRLLAAGVFALTMQPWFVAELPARGAEGEAHSMSAGLQVTLPAEWDRASTSRDMAMFGREIDVLRIVRLEPRELDTIITGVDELLARETRGVDVRSSERRFWRVGDDLVIEDVRSGVYEGRPITHVIFSRATAVGPVGLLFHYIGEADPRALLDRYRPIAVTLR